MNALFKPALTIGLSGDSYGGSGADLNTGSGEESRTGADAVAVAESDAELNAESNAESDAESDAGTGDVTDAGMSADTCVDQGANMNSDARVDQGENLNADTRVDPDASMNAGASVGPGVDLSASLSADPGANLGASLSVDLGANLSADLSAALSADPSADTRPDPGADLSANQSPDPDADEQEKPAITTITISAGGDCTLGMEYRASGINTFNKVFQEQGMDFSYFFKGVRDIFARDDLTIVNLEGALTDMNEPVDKQYAFKGSPSYAKILSSSGIEAVSLANNHTMDYRQAGYNDTIQHLTDEGVVCFGNERPVIINVKGVNIGLAGYYIQNDSPWQRGRIKATIDKLREDGARLIIAFYHWGDERVYHPNPIQTGIGRFTVDCGADLVLGAHPHVIQGIEVYKGKNIVYSLANLCFGGNQNPEDKDSFIFSQTFSFAGSELLEDNTATIIPLSISSTQSRNDYQPTILTGDEADRVTRKIRDASIIFSN